jgi:hypothetical protein
MSNEEFSVDCGNRFKQNCCIDWDFLWFVVMITPARKKTLSNI